MKKITLPVIALASIALTGWFASAQQTRKPVVTADALINAAGNGAEWLSYGHDYAETHFSPLAEINAKNVKRLSLAWFWETTGSSDSAELRDNST